MKRFAAVPLSLMVAATGALVGPSPSYAAPSVAPVVSCSTQQIIEGNQGPYCYLNFGYEGGTGPDIAGISDIANRYGQGFASNSYAHKIYGEQYVTDSSGTVIGSQKKLIPSHYELVISNRTYRLSAGESVCVAVFSNVGLTKPLAEPVCWIASS